MFIDDPSAERFIQFSKYSDRGMPLLHLSIPDAPRSHPFFDEIVNVFQQEAIPCVLRDDRRGGGL